jgi:hypothetical protein
MRINSSIVVHAIVFAFGLVTGAGLVYILGSRGENRPWVLWEHSTIMKLVDPVHSVEEWSMVAAGANKRDCEKRLAKLAEDLKKLEKVVVDTDQDFNTESGGVMFDGSILNKIETTTLKGEIVLTRMTKSLCFPDTVDPRSGASK